MSVTGLAGCSPSESGRAEDASPAASTSSSPNSSRPEDLVDRGGSSLDTGTVDATDESDDSGDSDDSIGVIVAREGVDVSAQLEGRLRSVAVRVGDRVDQGAELAQIEAHDLDEQLAEGTASLRAAQADVERAKAEAQDAQEQAARREEGGDLFSAEERQSAARAAEVAAAAVKSARAREDEQQAAVERLRARRGRSTIVAPIGGEVALRYLDPGAAVATGQPIVRLISADVFVARFAVSPRDAAQWNVGDRVEVEVESLESTFEGTVSQIAPRVDPASQMVFLEAELSWLEAPGIRLQDGLVATVRPLDGSETMLNTNPDTSTDSNGGSH